MKERKNIDRLFQERFKDFEAHPSPEVWAKIEDRLDQKKKRRVFPLWWKLGGIAALLAILFVTGNLYFAPLSNFPQKNDPQFVTMDSTKAQQKERIAQPSNNKDSVSNAVVFNPDQENSKTSKNSSKSSKKTNKPTISSSAIVSTTNSNSVKGENKSASNQMQPNSYRDSVNDAVVSNRDHETDKSGKTSPKSGEKTNKLNVSSSEIVSTTDSNSVKDKNNSAENKVQHKSPLEAVAVNSTEKSSEDTSENTQKTTNNAENRNAEQLLVSQNSEKTVATNDVESGEEKKLSEEKSLAQIVQEEQAANIADEATENEKTANRRWALTPNIAPVYYDSFGGSGIAPQFDGNSKEGRVNLSYGLLVSYAINDKLTVRSGLSKIDLSYNTNDAILNTGAQAGTLQSLNFDRQADVLQVESAVRAYSNSPLTNSGEISNIKSSEGYVNQSLAYFEVPMEVEYALVENRVGVQLIGGFSTLLLNNNALTFSDNDFKTSLPESTNLNDVSFSTNVGLGLDYKFTDDIKFNLQPMFKYQLNAYKNNVSAFKPYYLGLYTGFSIKF